MSDMPFQIGGCQLASNLCLSPLAGYTNLPFRLTVREVGGLGLATTDLVNARSILERNHKALKLIETSPEDRPLSVQLFGGVPEEMRDAAVYVESLGIAMVDINMGCPVRKVVQVGGGSAMMTELTKTAALVKGMIDAVKIPVPIQVGGGSQILSVVPTLRAGQWTELSYAVEEAYKEVLRNGKNYCIQVILLSDGTDTCGGDSADVLGYTKKIMDVNPGCNKINVVSLTDKLDKVDIDLYDKIEQIGNKDDKAKARRVNAAREKKDVEKAIEEAIAEVLEEKEKAIETGWESGEKKENEKDGGKKKDVIKKDKPKKEAKEEKEQKAEEAKEQGKNGNN